MVAHPQLQFAAACGNRLNQHAATLVETLIEHETNPIAP